MKFKSVMRWMLLIGLGATVVAGGAGVHYWNQRHDLVETQLRRGFDQWAPELRLVLGQTRLDGLHRLTLSDIEVRDRATDQPLLRARRVSVEIDSQTLFDGQRVVVKSVLVDGADALVVRLEDGRWNWQDYQFKSTAASSNSLPQIDVRQLRVQLHLKHGEDIPSARLLLTSPHFQAVPASAHSLDLDGTVEVTGAGALRLTGSCDLASGAWSLGGKLRDITADQKLVDLAQNTSPRVRDELQRLDHALQRILPPRQTVSVDPDPALLIGHDISTAPRFQGQLNVDFDIRRQPNQEVPMFQLLVDIKDGLLSVPGLPIRLADVNAELFVNNERADLRVHHSQYEDAQLSGQFAMNTMSGGAPPIASFRMDNLHVGPRLQSMCPPSLQRLFDRFQPDFRVSGSGQAGQRQDGKWVLQNMAAEVNEGRLLHHRFQYPLTNIQATIVQRPLKETNGQVIIDVRDAVGVAGGRPWKATGSWTNPGPSVKSHFVLDVAEFPLDRRFRDALEPKARKVVESLNLTGITTARLWFDRPAGEGKKTDVRIEGDVTKASLRFSAFQYEVNQLSGRVRFDARNNEPRPSATWDFRNLTGIHGDAQIFGEGHFTNLPGAGPGVLELTVGAHGLALDSDLYNALPESQQKLWQLIDPAGYCDVTAKIHWTAAPGQHAIVRFPAETPIRIFNARIRPRPFPYEMDVEEVKVSFDPNDPRFGGVAYCDIHSFKASHKDAPIVATGWTKSHPDGQWQVHLDHLTAERLPPDDELRAALPDSWREILTRLHRQGRVSIDESELDFKGVQAGRSDVTAAWNMNMYLHDCTLNAGLDLKHVTGSLTAAGHWDGKHLENEGAIRMESTRVLDMPLTQIQGPYSIADAKLVLGTQEVLESRQLSKVDRSQRMTAQAYGGTLFVDAVVDSRPGHGYLMFAELENASLQAFARQNMDRAAQLQGNIKGWLALKGEGDSPKDMKGSGQLEISPAALYELPVMLEVLKAFTSLNPGSRTAFDYAMLTFDVRNEQFQFNRVDLVGESMALRGRGSVGFGGDLLLDFYSRPASSRPRIRNLLSNLLVNGATQWAKVEVRGTTSRPQATLLPTAQLDDSVRQFLGAFNPVPGNVPRMAVPRVFPFADSPLTFSPLPFRRQ